MNFSEKKINQLLSGKSYKDENFPVASLIISKEIRRIIRAFYHFARMSDDISDNNKLSKGAYLSHSYIDIPLPFFLDIF